MTLNNPDARAILCREISESAIAINGENTSPNPNPRKKRGIRMLWVSE